MSTVSAAGDSVPGAAAALDGDDAVASRGLGGAGEPGAAAASGRAGEASPPPEAPAIGNPRGTAASLPAGRSREQAPAARPSRASASMRW
jgi:hypothetical protein